MKIYLMVVEKYSTQLMLIKLFIHRITNTYFIILVSKYTIEIKMISLIIILLV